jgi:PAP2 superfamily
MSCCDSKECKGDSYTVSTVNYNLEKGKAQLQLLKNQKPVKCGKTLEVSVLMIPNSGSILQQTQCQKIKIDCEGNYKVSFQAGSENQVRIETVYRFDDCCEKLKIFTILTPNKNLGISPLSYLGLSGDLKELELYALIQRCNLLTIKCTGLDHKLPKPDQLGPCRSSRAMAIAHIALSDAFNSVKKQFELYSPIGYEPKADVHTAMIQANYLALKSLFPQQADRIDKEFTELLNQIENSRAKIFGLDVGTKSAKAILKSRHDDGSQHPEVFDAPETTPEFGKWSKAPPDSNIGGSIALGRHWCDVKTFSGMTKEQYTGKFRCPPPPSGETSSYLAAFNQVKAVGGDNIITASSRDADETEAGIYWAYDGVPSLCAPPRLFNQLVVHIGTQYRFSPEKLLRTLVLANVAMADTGIISWESKYFYSVWRPITGIRYPDQKNPEAMPSSHWTCLGAPASNTSTQVNFTPPFPAYPSGHATFGGTVFQLLRVMLGGDNHPFTFVSDEYDGVTKDNHGVVRPFKPRSFERLSQAEMENGRSRLYLGIHWCFDSTSGINQGTKIANWYLENKFKSF